MKKEAFIILFGLLVFSGTLLGQSINTPFWKNRVQFNDDFKNWSKYETENFITYWYGKGRNIAQGVIQLSELDHDEIQQILEHRLSDKIEIVVYTDLTDVKQSNIGNQQAFTSKKGQTKIVGKKMFVYFDGDHKNLRKQIREGIASVYINSLLFGSNIQEVVQNAILLNLPEWFKEGLISYAGESWGTYIENDFIDLVSQNPKKYLNFEKLAKDNARIAGHSMWHFLEEKYGSSAISNIIYLTRINRQFEDSFYYIIGVDFYDVVQDWSSFYSALLEEKSDNFQTENLNANYIKIKRKRRDWVPSNVKINPQDNSLAYVINDKGKYRVYVRDLSSGQEKLIFKKGTKNIFQETDYTYPLIAFDPSGQSLNIIYDHRDKLYLRKIHIESKEYEEQSITEDYQRIYDFAIYDSKTYVFNASTDGYSDLYFYYPKSRSTKRITSDFYDDLDISIANIKGEKGILFSSNRTNLSLVEQKMDTILPLGHYDLFFLTENGKAFDITQLTETPNVSERKAFQVNNENISLLEENNSIIKRIIFNVENQNKYISSKFDRNILYQDCNSKTGQSISLVWKNGKMDIVEEKNILKETSNYTTKTKTIEPEFENFVEIKEEDKPIETGFLFQSKFPDPPSNSWLSNDENNAQLEVENFEKYVDDYFSGAVIEGKPIVKFNPVRASAARLNFKLVDFSTRLDNEVLFEGLQSYTDPSNTINGNPAGILFKGITQDIFEDYTLTGGIRVPTSFNGLEAFLVLDNDKKLFDHRFALYRRARTTIENVDFFPIIRTRRKSALGLYRIKYPFDVYRSVSLTGSLRFDKFFFLSADRNTLESPFNREQRLSVKAEYVFDNSFDHLLNIKHGTRYKAYAEVINEFGIQLVDGFSFKGSKGFTTLFGFDARHYIPVLKHAVLAGRVAGVTSFGTQRMLYFLGGMENSLFPSFNNNIDIPAGDNFAYQVLAPHLRGFDSNIRNGTTYVLSNIELRLPIVNLLGVSDIKFSLIRNLQVTGFFDAGLAWHGSGPNSDANPIFTDRLDELAPTVILDINYFRDPVVMGYGFGFRTLVLGYYLKFDYAYGIETRQRQNPKWYLTMGMDF